MLNEKDLRVRLLKTIVRALATADLACIAAGRRPLAELASSATDA